MKIYGHPMSTCTRKVLVALAEKGQQAEFVLVDFATGDHKKPEHLARQPFGVIPALDDDGFQLYESRAMMRYVDAKFPGVSLTPSDLKSRARMEQWISVEQSYVSPPLMKIVHEKVFKKMSGGGAPDLAVVEAARGKLSAALDVLEKALAKDEYLAGNAFSLAEVTLMPYIEYLFPAESGDLIASRAKLGAWWKRISERPSWKKVTQKA
jgi:glutathione S-transferase